jgi:hypothetical protein
MSEVAQAAERPKRMLAAHDISLPILRSVRAAIERQEPVLADRSRDVDDEVPLLAHRRSATGQDVDGEETA